MMKLLAAFIAGIAILFIVSCNEEQKPSENKPEVLNSNWKTYQAPDLRLKYPQEWILSVDTTEGEIFHISLPDTSLHGSFLYDVSLQYYYSEESFESFVKNEVGRMKKEFGIKSSNTKKNCF